MEKERDSGNRMDDKDWLAFWTTVGLDDPFHDVRTIRKLLSQEKSVPVAESAPSSAYEQKGKENAGREKTGSTWWIALKVFRGPIIASSLSVAALAGWIFISNFQDQGEKPEPQATAPADSRIGFVEMTRVPAIRQNGAVGVPVELVEKHKFVSFEYQGSHGAVPLMAYIAPSGKIVTALGISQPCNSRSFHLEGNEIVCNLCFTRWDLETLKGSSGECEGHSLNILDHFVNEGGILLKEADIQKRAAGVIRG